MQNVSKGNGKYAIDPPRYRVLPAFTLIFNDFFGKNDFQGFADYFSYIYCWKYLECARNVPWHFVAWFFILLTK